MKLRLSATLLILLTAIATTPSCKKKDKVAATGTFYMHLHTNVDTNEVQSTTTLYRDTLGRHFSLSVAQCYISNIRLHNTNGSTFPVQGAIVLQWMDNEQYLVGQAPTGTYDYVTFDVGLDAATNALQPTAFTSNGFVSNSSMWYGNATQGYAAMFIQGMADTTATQSGTNLRPFFYKIASATSLKTVTMPARGTGAYATFAPYVLTPSGAQYIHMICDYGILLSGVDFKTIDSTDSYTIKPWKAALIADNIPNAFRYED